MISCHLISTAIVENVVIDTFGSQNVLSHEKFTTKGRHIYLPKTQLLQSKAIDQCTQCVPALNGESDSTKDFSVVEFSPHCFCKRYMTASPLTLTVTITFVFWTAILLETWKHPARNFQPSFFPVGYSIIPISIHPSIHPVVPWAVDKVKGSRGGWGKKITRQQLTGIEEE